MSNLRIFLEIFLRNMGGKILGYNTTPITQEIISKVFPILFSFSFWIKEKSVVTLANRNICDQTQNIPKSILPPCYRTGDSAGEVLKSEVTLGIDHLYLLSLFDFHSLHYGSFFGLVLILYPDLGHLFR